MIELFLAFLCGILLGIVSGLFPELHPNLLASLLALSMTNIPFAAVLLMSMTVTSSVIDSIPAVFLGTPNPDSGIALLPAYVLLQKGFGADAVRLSVLGSLIGMIAAMLSVPLLVGVISFAYMSVRALLPWMLCLLVLFFILKEKGVKKLWAAGVFASAGLLGYIVLRSALAEPLTVLFGGLFAVPSLILALVTASALPAQTTASIVRVSPVRAVLSTVGAIFSGFGLMLVSGTSPSHASYVARAFAREPKHYLILQGAVRSADLIFSLVVVVLLGKARNGVVAVLQRMLVFTSDYVWSLVGVAFVSAGIAAIFCNWFVTRVPRLLAKLNYKRVCVLLLVFLFGLVVVLSDVQGLLILILAAAIGTLAITTGISRSHCMGVLIVPLVVMLV